MDNDAVPVGTLMASDSEQKTTQQNTAVGCRTRMEGTLSELANVADGFRWGGGVIRRLCHFLIVGRVFEYLGGTICIFPELPAPASAGTLVTTVVVRLSLGDVARRTRDIHGPVVFLLATSATERYLRWLCANQYQGDNSQRQSGEGVRMHSTTATKIDRLVSGGILPRGQQSVNTSFHRRVRCIR